MSFGLGENWMGYTMYSSLQIMSEDLDIFLQSAKYFKYLLENLTLASVPLKVIKNFAERSCIYVFLKKWDAIHTYLHGSPESKPRAV